jgi:PadR family transcriptional regulator
MDWVPSPPIATIMCRYVVSLYMILDFLGREVKRGSAELLILALLEHEPRHGYEIAKLIERRSRGTISFHLGSLYPSLYRLEERGLIEGRWVERAGERRRRYYRISAEGRRALAEQRSRWREFIDGLERAAGLRHA